MSTYFEEEISCPCCGDTQARKVAHSINATRMPQVREAILDGTFQQATCDKCGAEFSVEWPFMYIDYARHQWFGVFSEIDEGRFLELEAEPQRAYLLCAGPSAPPIAQQLAADMKVRAIFGMDALRDKLWCFEAGLDDVSIEQLKLRLLEKHALPALSPTRHLRLCGAIEQLLCFAYCDDEAGTTVYVAALRADYDAEHQSAQSSAWREALRDCSYIDAARPQLSPQVSVS
jgi:hypothetical protein